MDIWCFYSRRSFRLSCILYIFLYNVVMFRSFSTPRLRSFAHTRTHTQCPAHIQCLIFICSVIWGACCTIFNCEFEHSSIYHFFWPMVGFVFFYLIFLGMFSLFIFFFSWNSFMRTWKLSVVMRWRKKTAYKTNELIKNKTNSTTTINGYLHLFALQQTVLYWFRLQWILAIFMRRSLCRLFRLFRYVCNGDDFYIIIRIVITIIRLYYI